MSQPIGGVFVGAPSRFSQTVRVPEAVDRRERTGFDDLLGRSEVWRGVLEDGVQIAPTNATVLLQGETGTGKEVLAKAIHFGSLRRDRPFVIINCGSIPQELLESELFGHVRGSFTGAIADKKGKIEIADGGTVFLDEIGEMPPHLQVRVLRLVQNREIDKVGGVGPAGVDVRIIAATHRDLKAMVQAGTFREDLYYRLAVIPLKLPALRDRREDIPVFVNGFFERLKTRHGKYNLELPLSLMPYFVRYEWPGNIRQLENIVERIVVLARSEDVTVDDLPDELRRHSGAAELPVEAPRRLPESESVGLDGVERRLIVEALRKCGWNQTQAARQLHITRKTLLYRIAKHGIEKEICSEAPSVQFSYKMVG